MDGSTINIGLQLVDEQINVKSVKFTDFIERIADNLLIWSLVYLLNCILNIKCEIDDIKKSLPTYIVTKLLKMKIAIAI